MMLETPKPDELRKLPLVEKPAAVGFVAWWFIGLLQLGDLLRIKPARQAYRDYKQEIEGRIYWWGGSDSCPRCLFAITRACTIGSAARSGAGSTGGDTSTSSTATAAHTLRRWRAATRSRLTVDRLRSALEPSRRARTSSDAVGPWSG